MSKTTLCLVLVVSFVAAGSSAFGAAAHWDDTGSLEEGRQSHRATLLQSGEVLVTGGRRRERTLASAERFDPRTGRWTSAGELHQARYGHTATLLHSGQVLVTGGRVRGGEILDSCELFDPVTGTWSEAAPLPQPRRWHTATLLRSGKVLVVGGQPDSSAQIYHPETDTWEETGGLESVRYYQTATLLPSGKVLVVGGVNSTTEGISDAELYDPQTGVWTPTGSLTLRRDGHTATLLPSGKVLVAGGRVSVLTDDSSYWEYRAEAELYDPATGQWLPAGALRYARVSHTATLLVSGKVLIAGGQSSVGRFRDAEIYDPATGEWSDPPELRIRDARRVHTATLLPGGTVLIAGGEDLETGLASAELFTPDTAPFSTAEELADARVGHSATVLSSGDVLVAGGGQGTLQLTNTQGIWDFFSSNEPTASVELYQPATGTWSALAPLHNPRAFHAATLLPSGGVLVTGGEEEGKVLSSVELYDVETGLWSESGSLRIGRLGHTATCLPSGKVLIAGGINEEAAPGGEQERQSLASTEVYDPAAGQSLETDSLHVARAGHTATLLASGKVLVVGGSTENQLLKTAELYDPATGSWSPTDSLAGGRILHTATLLPSGEVLVAGGAIGHAGADSELYDPVTGTWSPVGPLAEARLGHRATLLPDGRVLVTGGARHGTYSFEGLSSIVEVYDPALGTWSEVDELEVGRGLHTATLLHSGQVLLAGGWQLLVVTGTLGPLASAELFPASDLAGRRRPEIRELSGPIRHGEPLTITGSHFRGDSEASQGDGRNSAVDLPLVQLRGLADDQLFWLVPAESTFSSAESTTLTFRDFPPALNPGWHLLTVYAAGVPSEARRVRVECGLVIDEHPADQIVPLGSIAVFSVKTQGGRTLQWFKDGIPIPGATAATYTSPPISAADSGTIYTVHVSSGCKDATSEPATLIVEDHEDPTVDVLYPDGGEYWELSEPDQAPNVEVVTWSMADNIRICRVEAQLLYSDDGGISWAVGPSATFGPGGACAHPGEGRTGVEYAVPGIPPSEIPGSLYKVRIRVTDHAGLTTEAESENPFYIVEPNDESVKTLIVTHLGRMTEVVGADRVDRLAENLHHLADHPRIQGEVLDLAGVTALQELYARWDGEADPELANLVLFGCHEPFPARCDEDRDGIHDVIRDRLRSYTGVEHLILAGDDRIVPMARVKDRTVLFLESNYTSDDPADLNAGLTPDGTTVGRALAADYYLSDDPLAVLAPIAPQELEEEGAVFLPELAVGRLVESPEEIIAAIATFISKDGVLDLTELDVENGHKVLVSAYDFLLDSGKSICRRWQTRFGVVESCPGEVAAPVNSRLLTDDWGEDSVDARRQAFLTHLEGGGERYAVVNANGHATHHELGVPGIETFDIHGLSTRELAALDLAGSVVYAVGCHGGLSVADAGDPVPDLPQTMLSRGALAYLANSGYGWGLRSGIGQSERLVEIFTEELTRGGTVVVGEAVRRSKERYFLESPRFDDYDVKTLLQWTFYGFPMLAVRTGIAAGSQKARRTVEDLGAVVVEQKISVAASDPELPPYLTRLQQRFDLSAAGVYEKHTASGEVVAEGVAGCPDPGGCYYTLNGLATGTPDLPIEPMLVYDSRLVGTSQHGVLWMGGRWQEEAGWVPIFAELVSNGGDGSDHGSTPRAIYHRPRGVWRRGTKSRLDGTDDCRPSDLDLNSVVVVTGEAVKASADDETFSLMRLHRTVDLEVFYYNNPEVAGANCDRQGPLLGDGPYHEVRGTTVEWAVEASDEAGVWRVVVVYTDGGGRWLPLELTGDGSGVWRGRLHAGGPAWLTYYLQAVDGRGNVSWLLFEPEEKPASGVDPGLPLPVEVAVVPGTADLAVGLTAAPDPVAVGAPVLYSIAVRNLGPDLASSVALRQTLPEDVTWVAAGGPGWSCGEQGAQVTCEREELEVGHAVTVSVMVLASDRGGSLTSYVEVDAAEDDPVAGNDTASTTTEVREL
ncbi:MAG: hypothetical protein GY856_54680 [bacterium]|nr:hypothetical protein [bacterium]